MDGFLAHAVHLPRQMMGGPRSLLHLLNSLGMHPIHVNARGEEVWGPEADSDDDEEEEPYIPLDNIEEGADSDEDEDGSDGGSHCHSWAADAVVDEEEGNFSGV